MKIQSKLAILGLLVSTLMAPSISYAAQEMHATSQAHAYKEITATELKNWIDSGKKMQIVDARPKKYDEGDVITGAKFLPYDSDPALIAKVLPSKDATIVAYCASIKCPASTRLSEKLTQMGYTNVYKYPEGLADWEQKGYPTSKAAN